MNIADEKLFGTIREYLTLYLPRQRCLSDHTIKSYRAAINQFIDYLGMEQKVPIRKVSFSHFSNQYVACYADWLRDARGCADSSINQRILALRAFAKYCATMDAENMKLYADICKVPFRKTPSKMVEFFTEDALQTLLAQPDMRTQSGLRNGFFMILMYDTGARCQEMLDLRLRDFVTDTPSPYVYLTGKGAKTRAVPLMQKTLAHYKAYVSQFHPEPTRNRDNLLFYTVIHGQRNPMSPDTVAHFLRKIGRSAHEQNLNVPENVHPHQFRHTRAIHLYRTGVPLTLVAEILGHAQVSTTQVYAYADTEMKREAILKAAEKSSLSVNDAPCWKNNEDMIRRLYGLK
ncbi:MAG: site-specific integrase [Oscillospiraceae bacterium]|nr:site-specific integrase [Oscillospiraceae bacterium]